MCEEKVKFIKAEYFEEPTTISNVVEYLSSYMNVRGNEVVEGCRTVLWSKFVSCDYNDIRNNIDHQCDAILIFGTDNALQVHKLGMDGKLCLLFSSTIGRIESATIVPSPLDSDNDLFAQDRPIIAAVLESRVAYYSMCSGRSLKEVPCQTDLVDVCATSRLIVASSRSHLVLLCPCKLAVLTVLQNCRDSGYPRVPVAHCISEHWLAFAEHSLSPIDESVGGDLSDPSEKPYALSLLDIKKKVTPVIMGEDGDKGSEEEEKGVVTIVSVDRVLDCIGKSETVFADDRLKQGLLIAHFTAHRWTPVSRMVFDWSGTLLMTACQQGIYCHLFRVVPHPTRCSETAVLHLYRLYRGETPRAVVSMTISKDGRLAAAASDHGTVHVWPVSSYGGPLCVRTHCQGHVVNRLSRLERSSGMHEHQVTRPHTTVTTVTTTANTMTTPNHALHQLCPRLPPFPYPCTLHSYAQLKPLSTLPPQSAAATNRPLSLVPFFFSGHSISSPGSYSRTEWILVSSPDSRLLQYALNIHPDSHSQPLATRTELDGHFVIEKRSYLQWRITPATAHCLDRNAIPPLLTLHSKNTRPSFYRHETQTALLQSVLTDLSESLEHLCDENAATPQCWFSNIEISSQISFTSSIKRQDKFSISTYQGKEPSDARLEVLVKSASISSELSSVFCRGEEQPREEGWSQPVRVPQSDQRIQICNSFCGSSISDSLPECGASDSSVIFALAHAIQDEEGLEEAAAAGADDHWEECRSPGYIEHMTKDMSHVRLRRVSGSFSSDIVRLSLLSTSPSHVADIPEEKFSDMGSNRMTKQLKQRVGDAKKKRKS